MIEATPIGEILMKLSNGLLPGQLSTDQINLLKKEYGVDWFTKLGYTEPKYINPENKPKLSVREFMVGMCNAPFDYNICKECGGTGLRPVKCCSGRECGCMGMPVDFVDCDCGRPVPSEEQIKKWSKE